MQNFKDLKVWRKSHELTLAIYELTRQFPQNEMYALTSQVRRATFSIPSNIAEGCGRNTNADFAHFLNIALGSINELDYFILLSKDLNYVSSDMYINTEKMIGEIRAMLISLINKIRNTYNSTLTTQHLQLNTYNSTLITYNLSLFFLLNIKINFRRNCRYFCKTFRVVGSPSFIDFSVLAEIGFHQIKIAFYSD